MIARVVPLTRTRAVRGAFDYLLPNGDEQVAVGSVLRVPFGGQRPLGVVVELADGSELEPGRLAEPDQVLAVSLPDEMVALAVWMAHEYCSTTARALTLMLAPGTGGRDRGHACAGRRADARRVRGPDRLGRPPDRAPARPARGACSCSGPTARVRARHRRVCGGSRGADWSGSSPACARGARWRGRSATAAAVAPALTDDQRARAGAAAPRDRG